MRMIPRRKSELIIAGFVLGVLVVWIIGLFIHLPGTNTAYTPATTYTPNTNGNTQAHNTYGAGQEPDNPVHCQPSFPYIHHRPNFRLGITG